MKNLKLDINWKSVFFLIVNPIYIAKNNNANNANNNAIYIAKINKKRIFIYIIIYYYYMIYTINFIISFHCTALFRYY